MAPATVRAGLAQLEREGYIKLDARRTAKVLYRITPQQLRENAARYFVPRAEGILDVNRSGQVLFEPLWEAGLRRWSQTDWDDLRRELASPSPGAASMPVEFYLMSLRALDNRLALNLYWEMVRYIRFPYLGDRDLVPWEDPDLPQEEAIARLKQEFESEYVQAVTELFAFIDKSRTGYGLEDMPPIPFRWNIYRQRPQLRYSLASRIIQEILEGKYPVGGYLPSLTQMTEQYGVALSTVRRALSMLEDMGVTQSQHGKGTQVLMEPKAPNTAEPSVQEGLRLYRESLQLLALTIRGVCLETLEAAGPEQRDRLAERFAKLRMEGRAGLCFETCLGFLVQNCPMAMVREAYGRIRELLAWGYPIALARTGQNGLHRAYAESAALMESHLWAQRWDDFAALWEELLEQEEAQAAGLIT